MIGQTISHYKILEKLGEGGMGVVYKAEDTRLDRTVALKLLAPHLLQHSESRTRFVREAKASATLEHPNICMVFEIDEVEGQTFLAMSFVDGDSLREKIERRPLKLEEALDLAIQSAEGLQAAHENGIVHRDIKPGNVMLTKRGQVKILDFGLAQLGKRTRITKSGTTLGTPAYMSPEQVEGREVDRRSDIWSLGVVIYEMLTGRLPFEGDTEQAVSHKILYEEPEPPTALRGRLPLELDRIVEKALAKDPVERYQHADDLIVDLRKLKRQSESGIVTQTAQTVPARPKLIWRRPAVLVAAALVVIAVVLIGVLMPDGTGPEPVTPLSAVPLTSYPGLERHPTLSPDGTQVAFRWNGQQQNNWDIYAKVIGPEESRQRLTTDPAEDYSPAWSPDGTRIAFLRDLGETKAGVFVVPARGGTERKVAEVYDMMLRWRLAGGLGKRITWTPDSQRLIVGGAAPDPNSRGLFVVSPTSAELRRIEGPGLFPVISPDGRKLAFRRNFRLHVLPLSDTYEPTGEAARISDAGVGLGIFWGPDSQELFFAGDGRLWRVSASGGGEPQIVQSVTGPVNAPVVSYQRRRLVYSTGQGWANIWRSDLAQSGQPQGPQARLGPSSMSYDVSPRCSPDGTRIAFESGRGGHAQIYVCDSDGRNLVQLTSTGGQCPTWSPDGRRIAYLKPRGTGASGLYVMNDDGSGVRLLTETWAINPSWSHDGKWIYYSVGSLLESEVWKIPAEGGVPIQLTRRAPAANGATPQESMDGQYVYYVKGDGLWKTPVGGDEETQVLDSVYLRNYAIWRDGIYFIPIPKPGEPWSFCFLQEATGEIEIIANLDHHPAQGMSTPLDGRYIVSTQREWTSDLKLVEDFGF